MIIDMQVLLTKVMILCIGETYSICYQARVHRQHKSRTASTETNSLGQCAEPWVMCDGTFAVCDG